MLNFFNSRSSSVALPRVALATLTLLVGAASTFAQQTIHVPADQPTIQAAINAANNGDTVLVAPGTYTENINFNGKLICVAGSGPSATIIDGGAKGSVVTFQSGETASAILEGFTIRNGLAVPFTFGGGIYIYGASPSITGNIITQNHADAGIGIYVGPGSPFIQNNTISGNSQPASGGLGGGGIYIAGNNNVLASPTITNNFIINNSVSVGGDGGGILVGGFSGALVQNNFIQGNTAWNNGGGVALESNTYASLVQNVIVNNTSLNGGTGGLSGGSGGGLYVYSPNSFTTQVANNTIAENRTLGARGVGVYVYGFGQYVTFTNNIIDDVFCSPFYSPTSPVFSYNDVFAPTTGNEYSVCDLNSTPGNITADPLFLSPTNGDFHVQATSPIVNAGTNSVQILLSTDFDGNPRLNQTIDMGAYELVHNSTASMSPDSLLFAPQMPGTVSSQQGALLSNTGTVPFQITSVQISDPFSFMTNCPPTGVIGALADVPVGGFCVYYISLAPSANWPLGAATGTLVVNGTNGVSWTVALSGTVGPPLIPTSVNLTANPNPASYGQNVALGYVFSGGGGGVSTPAPTGSFTIYDNGVPFQSYPIGSITGLTMWPASSLGTHSFTASYSGDSNYASSTSAPVIVSVNPAATTTTVTSTLNPASFGQGLYLTATVNLGFTTGTPLYGTVSFYDGGTPIATGLIYGNHPTQFATTTLSAGTHSITAQFFPSSQGYLGSTSAPFVETITPGATTLQLASSPNPSLAGQLINLSATVVPTLGAAPPLRGSVTFYDGGVSLSSASPNTANVASIAVALGAGTHALSAQYSGTPNLLPSTSPTLLQTVTLTSTATTVVSSLNPALATQSVTFTASVQPSTATGTVNFIDGATSLGTATLSNGSAQIATTLSAGSHSISASYAGSAIFAPSATSVLTEVVNSVQKPGGFFVRGAVKKFSTASTNSQLSLNAEPQQGDLLIAYVAWNSASAAISSVTDNCSNTWIATPAQTDTVDATQAQLFYAAGSKPCSTSINVSVTFSAAVLSRVTLGQWSGVGAGAVYYDASASNFQTATKAPSASVTTANAQDLLIQVGTANNSSNQFTSAGGFTNRVSGSGMVLADQTVPLAQAYSTSLTSSTADNEFSGIFAFQLTTTPAFPVQSSSNSGTAKTISCALPQNVRAGDVLAAYVWWQGNSTVSISVSDNLNGAWSAAGAQATETVLPHSSQFFYVANSGAGPVTITATPSNGLSQPLYLECTELTGLAASSVVDGTPATAEISAKTVFSLNVGPLSTTNTNELLILGCTTNAGNAFKIPSGFTQLQSLNHEFLAVGSASSPGNFSTICSGGGAYYTGNLAAFQ